MMMMMMISRSGRGFSTMTTIYSSLIWDVASYRNFRNQRLMLFTMNHHRRTSTHHQKTWPCHRGCDNHYYLDRLTSAVVAPLSSSVMVVPKRSFVSTSTISSWARSNTTTTTTTTTATSEKKTTTKTRGNNNSNNTEHQHQQQQHDGPAVVDYQSLAMEKVVLLNNDEVYNSIDAALVEAEVSLQRLAHQMSPSSAVMSTGAASTTNNGVGFHPTNGNNNISISSSNPNYLLNLLEVLCHNDSDHGSGGTATAAAGGDESLISARKVVREQIFPQIVQSKHIRLLQRAESIVLYKYHDPILLRMLVDGYVHANAPYEACRLLQEWPNQSSLHQPGLKSYRLVLTALSEQHPQSNPLHESSSSSSSLSTPTKAKTPATVVPLRNDQRALNLLNHLIQQHKKFPQLDLTPDRDCFHRVLASCTTPDAIVTTARDVLDMMMTGGGGVVAATDKTQQQQQQQQQAYLTNIQPTRATIRVLLDVAGASSLPSSSSSSPSQLRKRSTERNTSPFNSSQSSPTTSLFGNRDMVVAVFDLFRELEPNLLNHPMDGDDQYQNKCQQDMVIDIASYNVLFNILAEMGDHDCAGTNLLLRRLIPDAVKGRSTIGPDEVTLHTVLKASVNANTIEAAEVATALLYKIRSFCKQWEKQQQQSKQQRGHNAKTTIGRIPTTSSSLDIHTVIDPSEYEVYDEGELNDNNVNSKRRRSQHQQQPSLEWIGTIQPTGRAYGIVIGLWAKLQQTDRAMALLIEAEEMYREAREKEKQIGGDNDTNSIDNVNRDIDNSRIHNNEHDENHHDMVVMDANDETKFLPDRICYHSVIGALSKQEPATPSAAAQAQELVERMAMIETERLGRNKRQRHHPRSEREVESDSHQPNLVTCNTVLHCWTRAGRPKQAEAFLTYMKDTLGIQPDIVSYNTVIHGYSKAWNANSAIRLLEDLLADRNKVSSSDEEQDHRNDVGALSSSSPSLPVPNTRTFTAILVALSRIQTLAAAQQAEGILSQMQELHETQQGMDTRPNIITYNAVLNCWSSLALKLDREQQQRQKVTAPPPKAEGSKRRTSTTRCSANSPPIDKTYAANRAEELLRHMQGLSENERPNHISYNTVMKAYSNDLSKAESLMDEMIHNQGLEPIESNYHSLMHVLARDDRVVDKVMKEVELRGRFFSNLHHITSSTSGFSTNDGTIDGVKDPWKPSDGFPKKKKKIKKTK